MSCFQNLEKPPSGFDHLIYTAPSLQQGMNEIEELLGVRPVIGGQLKSYGVHNALVSIGDSIYLEIMAPDVSLDGPINGRLLEQSYLLESKLSTWVLRSKDLRRVYNDALSQNLRLGEIIQGNRKRQDDVVLTWEFTDPYALPFDGAFPVLIDWQTTPHPSKGIPDGGELVGFEIICPEPEKLKAGFELLNANVNVRSGEKFKISATIKTKNGVVILQ